MRDARRCCHNGQGKCRGKELQYSSFSSKIEANTPDLPPESAKPLALSGAALTYSVPKACNVTVPESATLSHPQGRTDFARDSDCRITWWASWARRPWGRLYRVSG